jgi:ketosteroid isomerase-like protein
LKVLRYTSKLKNVQVEGGVASAWYEKEAEYKLSPESAPFNWNSMGLMVLKRQNDGSWKAAMVWPE